MADPKMTLVPIALREDGTAARMHFPADITREEAEKIARVILAYASPIAERGEGERER